MFLKRNRRHKNGETYEYWTLVETVRTLKGPRQRTVCHLGKLPGLDKRHRQSWESINYLLDGVEPPAVQTQFEDSLMDPAKLWRWYIQLTQAEECFRISKTDLHLRPVFHQKTGRVQAHILVCFLTLAMWRSLEMWMKSKGLGTCARQLIKEVSTVRMMNVILPVKSV